jgi:hypothetical protein
MKKALSTYREKSIKANYKKSFSTSPRQAGKPFMSLMTPAVFGQLFYYRANLAFCQALQ